MKEIWKDVVDYKGLYQVSNLGRVKSLDRYVAYSTTRILHRKSVLLKPTFNHKGYKIVMLCKNNKLKSFQIHRLVAETFIPNPENKPQVNHKDGNKLNNCITNLEWVTPKENMLHAYKNNLIKRENIMKCVYSSIEKRKKPIYQIKDNVIVNEFDSVINACRYLGLKSTNPINNVLKGKCDNYKGYLYTYKEKGN